MKPEDFDEKRVNWKPKIRLQLFPVYYDSIFSRDLIINTNIWTRSVNSKDLSRDLVVVVKMVYIPLVSTDGMPFTSRMSFSLTALNRTMGAEPWMRPLEEELEVKLPLKEEDEEELFIFKAGKMTQEGITFGKCEREDRVFEPF